MDTTQVSWRNIDEAIKRVLKMITDHERFVTEVRRTSGQGLQGVRSEYKSLEVWIFRNLNSLFYLNLFRILNEH